MIRLALLSMAVGFSGAVVPGPLFAVTLQQALLVGWLAGLLIAFGHMLAELILIIALRLGLGGVLQRPQVARAIGIIGGGVLLFFAWGMFGLALHGHIITAQAHSSALSVPALVGQGFALSVFNPYWILWWATVGIGLISSQLANQGRRAWVVFFFGHTMADYIWFTLVSLLISIGGRFLSDTIHRGIIGICGLGITVLGVMFIAKPVMESLRPKVQQFEISKVPQESTEPSNL